MALKSFLLGALDRQRLDSVAREMLGSLHIDLHNELVLTILYNCQPQVRPPPSDSISIALRSAKLSLRPSVDSLFKRKLKRSIGEMNLDYGQRQCLKQSGSLNKQLSNDLWFTEKVC
jgi:hypothetical protein